MAFMKTKHSFRSNFRVKGVRTKSLFQKFRCTQQVNITYTVKFLLQTAVQYKKKAVQVQLPIVPPPQSAHTENVTCGVTWHVA